MKLVVACDSFKGSLSAAEACATVAATLGAAFPAAAVTCVPLADGGEGTAGLLVAARGGVWVESPNICGPLPGRRLTARVGWIASDRLAIVESAVACGLPLLAPAERNPLHTTTRGVGELLLACLPHTPDRIWLTLGGSGTVDGGTGLARALGWRFLAKDGRDVPEGGGGLAAIARLVPPQRAPRLPPVTALCDVRNPLCGPAGAARVFGPQKGATAATLPLLEEGLENLARLVQRDLGLDVTALPGGGAAGGMGAGVVAFLGAALVPGFPAIAEACGLRAALQDADWVVTGEGSFDRQSLDGKVVSGVLDLARDAGVPVAVLAGRVRLSESEWRAAGVSAALAAAPDGCTEADALAGAQHFLAAAAVRWAAFIQASPAGPAGPFRPRGTGGP